MVIDWFTNKDDFKAMHENTMEIETIGNIENELGIS
jgi:hypothetical protein